MNAVFRILRRGPRVAILYVLVYWGRTLFVVCLIASNVLWLLGSPVAPRLLLGTLALVAAAFSCGLEVGSTGPPPGRRR